MISCVYDKHISNKYSIENYNMFMNDIIDDILMGKISSVENKIIIKGCCILEFSVLQLVFFFSLKLTYSNIEENSYSFCFYI